MKTTIFFFLLLSPFILFSNENREIASTENGNIYNTVYEMVTLDGGRTWKQAFKIKNIHEIRKDGHFRTTNGGISWIKFEDQKSIYEDVTFDRGKTWKKTLKIKNILEIRKDGHFRTTDGGISWNKVGENEAKKSSIIKLAKISDNGIIANLDLTLDVKANISLFDLNGNRIFYTLSNLSNGINSIEYNKELPKGIYILVIKTEASDAMVYKLVK